MRTITIYGGALLALQLLALTVAACGGRVGTGGAAPGTASDATAQITEYLTLLCGLPASVDAGM